MISAKNPDMYGIKISASVFALLLARVGAKR